MKILEAKNLIKRYNGNLALDNVSISIEEGDIIGLLGPNGAGKSTLISCISGVISPNSGEVEVFGKSLKTEAKAIKEHIGLVPQDIAFYKDLSAYENVKFFASLYNLTKKELEDGVKDALEFVGLSSKKDSKPKTFSGGMQRRLNIACALAHRPKLLIMDEPTVGIDPQSRNYILESVFKLREIGITVVYTSHYMEEVEYLCNTIHILDKGRLIESGSKRELKARLTEESNIEIEITNISYNALEDIKTIKGVVDAELKGSNLSIRYTGNRIGEIVGVLEARQCILESMSLRKQSLEDVFLNLTGKTLRD